MAVENSFTDNINNFGGFANIKKQSSFSCLLQNNRFSPRRLNFNTKNTNVSTWFSQYTEIVNEIGNRLAVAAERHDYEHTNSSSMTFYSEGY